MKTSNDKYQRKNHMEEEKQQEAEDSRGSTTLESLQNTWYAPNRC